VLNIPVDEVLFAHETCAAQFQPNRALAPARGFGRRADSRCAVLAGRRGAHPPRPELTNAIFRKLCVDKENTVYVLTDKGVARIFDNTLALDRSYRPLAGKIAKDIALTRRATWRIGLTTRGCRTVPTAVKTLIPGPLVKPATSLESAAGRALA